MNKKVVFPAILVTFMCNVGSKHVFPIPLLDLVFCCSLGGVLFLEVGLVSVFLCCLLAKRNTIDSFLVFGSCILCSCSFFLFGFCWFVFRYQGTNPKTLETWKKCNMNP